MTRDPFEQRVPASSAPAELSLTGYLSPRPQAQKPAIPAANAPPALSAIGAAVDRLVETIDQETRALAGGESADFSEFNRRKSQSLLELTRLGRSLPQGLAPALRDRLGRLAEKLRVNHRLLGLHLAAVRDIADLMVGALHEAESDGTYGKSRSSGGLKR